jgi:hypothetical protein
MFAWEREFYDHLAGQVRAADHNKHLEAVLARDEWKRRFQRTGVAFFDFICEWCRYVHHVTHYNAQLPWEILPGYNEIMRAFLLELKYRDLRQYPDQLREASNMLLHNPIHLNVFLNIVYRKTKYITLEGNIFISI